MPNNFQKQLEKQLKFIESSCNLFDQGDMDEAVRIATSLRVLFHNTNASTSLLFHMGETRRKMLSTAGSLSSPATPATFAFLLTSINIQVNQQKMGMWYIPKFLDHGGHMMDFPLWWDKEPVFIMGVDEITRKRLVLAAANKDSGAHVDVNLEPMYERIQNGEVGITKMTVPTTEGPKDFDLKHGTAVAIRQIAFETLWTFSQPAQWRT